MELANVISLRINLLIPPLVVLNEALTGGEWSIDDTQLPQNLLSVSLLFFFYLSLFSQRRQTNLPPSPGGDLSNSLVDLVSPSHSSSPLLIPISSLDNRFLNLQVIILS